MYLFSVSFKILLFEEKYSTSLVLSTENMSIMVMKTVIMSIFVSLEILRASFLLFISHGVGLDLFAAQINITLKTFNFLWLIFWDSKNKKEQKVLQLISKRSFLSPLRLSKSKSLTFSHFSSLVLVFPLVHVQLVQKGFLALPEFQIMQIFL